MSVAMYLIVRTVRKSPAFSLAATSASAISSHLFPSHLVMQQASIYQLILEYLFFHRYSPWTNIIEIGTSPCCRIDQSVVPCIFAVQPLIKPSVNPHCLALVTLGLVGPSKPTRYTDGLIIAPLLTSQGLVTSNRTLLHYRSTLHSPAFFTQAFYSFRAEPYPIENGYNNDGPTNLLNRSNVPKIIFHILLRFISRQTLGSPVHRLRVFGWPRCRETRLYEIKPF
jgi:hypothetical protein